MKRSGDSVVVALVVFFVVAALPAWGQTRLRVPFTQFTLPNGLHVILHEDHTVPIATLNVWYHVGSGREKPGRTGFAHLFEHLMFEGSGHVKEGEIRLRASPDGRLSHGRIGKGGSTPS